MALPPKETYFFFEEPHSDFRGILTARLFPKRILADTNTFKLSSDANVFKFTIIDASRADKFDEEKEFIGTPLMFFFDCNKGNLKHAIDFFNPQRALAFKDEGACLEYLYAVIAQAVYGAIIDFDEEEVFNIFQAYRADTNSNAGIINCCDANNMPNLPIGTNLFFTNVVNSIEAAHKILTATTIFKNMSKYANKCTTALIVAPNRKSYQKVFWCEKEDFINN